MAALPKYHSKIPQYHKCPFSKNIRNLLTHGSRGSKSEVKVTLFWRGDRESMVYANMGAGVTARVEYVEVRRCLVSVSIVPHLIPFRQVFSLNLKLTVLG